MEPKPRQKIPRLLSDLLKCLSVGRVDVSAMVTFFGVVFRIPFKWKHNPRHTMLSNVLSAYLLCSAGMDYRQLRYFVTVADEGTVSAAADVLEMTQPALSRQIQKTEADTGMVLFRRTRPRITVTSEGRELLDAARPALEKFENVNEVARRITAGEMRSISVAAPRTTLIDVVAPFVAGFSTTDPVPSVSEMPIAPDLSALLTTTDLAVTTRQPKPGTRYLPLARLPVCAHVPRQHPLAEDRGTRGQGAVPVELSDLVKEQLIVTTSSFKARRILDSALELAGLTPQPVIEATHGRITQALAAAGRGIAVVSDDPRFDLRAMNISHRGTVLAVPLFAVWRADHFAAERIRALAGRLQDFCRSQYGDTLLSYRGGPDGP